MADVNRDGKTLNVESSDLRRFYWMERFLQPDIQCIQKETQSVHNIR